jgi:hypothetical protein
MLGKKNFSLSSHFSRSSSYWCTIMFMWFKLKRKLRLVLRGAFYTYGCCRLNVSFIYNTYWYASQICETTFSIYCYTILDSWNHFFPFSSSFSITILSSHSCFLIPSLLWSIFVLIPSNHLTNSFFTFNWVQIST